MTTRPEVYATTAEVVEQCAETRPGRFLSISEYRRLENAVADAMFASLHPGRGGKRGAHPADVYAPDVGPVKWNMRLPDVENAIRTMPYEYLVVFAGSGRSVGKQMGRFGPRSTLRIIAEAQRANPSVVANLGATSIIEMAKRNCAVDDALFKPIRDDGNATITHNHPSGNRCLSPQDIALAAHLNVAEIRVATRIGGMRLARTGDKWKPDANRLYDMAHTYAHLRMTDAILGAGGVPSHAPNTRGYSDALWLDLLVAGMVAQAEPLGLVCEAWRL